MGSVLFLLSHTHTRTHPVARLRPPHRRKLVIPSASASKNLSYAATVDNIIIRFGKLDGKPRTTHREHSVLPPRARCCRLRSTPPAPASTAASVRTRPGPGVRCQLGTGWYRFPTGGGDVFQTPTLASTNNPNKIMHHFNVAHHYVMRDDNKHVPLSTHTWV